MMTLKVSLFTQLLREVGYAQIEVSGCSMLPAIWPGDVVRVESTPAQIGDIILFDRDGLLCAHRFLAQVDGHVMARGDANRRLDSPVPYNHILGRVTSLERNGTVISTLRFKPFASFIVRNSFVVRRVLLRLHDLRRKRIERLEVNSALAKSEA